MKAPTIHHPAETVCFPEYPKLKAIVEDTASAYDIVGGGFVSVCIINAENKLQQVRTIDRNEAWSAIAPTT